MIKIRKKITGQTRTEILGSEKEGRPGRKRSIVNNTKGKCKEIQKKWKG